MILVKCPSCQRTHKADESLLGKRAKCKDCGATFEVRSNEPQLVQQSSAGALEQMAAAARAAAADPPEPATENVSVVNSRLEESHGRFMKPIYSLSLAIVAFILSLLAVYLALSERIPGRGLSAYNLTTPQDAVRSNFQIQGNGDVRGILEQQMARIKDESDINSVLNTIEFHKTIECDGNVLVLYKYQARGLDRYESEWLKKSKDGRFLPTSVATFNWSSMGGDKATIKALIDEWDRKKLKPEEP